MNKEKMERLEKIIKILEDDFIASNSKYFGQYVPKGGEDFPTRFNESLEKVMEEYKDVDDITPLIEIISEAFKAAL